MDHENLLVTLSLLVVAGLAGAAVGKFQRWSGADEEALGVIPSAFYAMMSSVVARMFFVALDSENPLFLFGLMAISGLTGAVVGKFMFRRKGRNETIGAFNGAVPSMISAAAGWSIVGLFLFVVVAYFLPVKESQQPLPPE